MVGNIYILANTVNNMAKKLDWREVLFWITIVLLIVLLIASFFKS